jgi:hypothetical protein
MPRQSGFAWLLFLLAMRSAFVSAFEWVCFACVLPVFQTAVLPVLELHWSVGVVSWGAETIGGCRPRLRQRKQL